jgi:hypothetical protein
MPTVWTIGIGTTWSSYEELKTRRVVAQGWSSSGDLADLFRQPDHTVAQDARITDLDDSVGQRTLTHLLCHIMPGDLVIGCEGRSAKGICEIGPGIAYGYDVDGTVSHVNPTRFHPDEHFEYANILFHVEWVDWGKFQQVTGRTPPTISAQNASRIVRCRQDPAGILEAWTRHQNVLRVI